MVKEINYQERVYFYCEDCKLVYDSRDWAVKCEDWCRENDSCNIEITGHSIKKTLDGLIENDK